jgi:hypothetical protein
MRRSRGLGDVYKRQAMNYSKLEFDVFKNGSTYKKIPIFICPALSYNYFILNEFEQSLNVKSNLIQQRKNDFSHLLHHQDRHSKYHKHHTFNGLLGGFNIGEVRRNFDRSFYFSLSNKIIFSTEKDWQTQNIKGLHIENYSKLNEIPIL